MIESGVGVPPVVIVNPIPKALDHYQRAILESIEASQRIGEFGLPIEGKSGLKKAGRALQIVAQRLLLRPKRGSSYLVLWPAFGYFDVLTWLTVANHARVFIVVHDVTPLRHQFGHSRAAHFVFGLVLRARNLHAMCHTDEAAAELFNLTGVRAQVVPLPILTSVATLEATAPVTVRVLGQFKQSRALEPLQRISAEMRSSHILLEIIGRGWPQIEGWKVEDRFVPEEEFESLTGTASCVVIPYSRFYQSDVAVRCLEALSPVVAPRHPQIEHLFGSDWVGIVDDDDWSGAIQRAVGGDWRRLLTERRAAVSGKVAAAWHRALAENL